ncbi:MAG: DUF1153 domain-containing protein [Alphaproteobacteria bacterium]
MSHFNAAIPASGETVRIVRISEHKRELGKLPPPDTKRWVMRRKAAVVAGVHDGLLSVEEACSRYQISEEEFKSWVRLMDNHGERALRATRLKDYRDSREIAHQAVAAE